MSMQLPSYSPLTRPPLAVTELDVSVTTAVRLSIVVPAFNEAERLASTVAKLHALFSGYPDFEVIIVNDGSADATLAAAAGIVASCENCHLVSYATNRGKGYALRRGFAAARGELVAFLDADGEIDPAELLALLEQQRRTGASAVVGKKVVVGPRPWYRELMTLGIRFTAKRFFHLPVTDSQAGIKVFVKAHISELINHCTEPGYLFDLELLTLAHRRGLNIQQHPVTYQVLRPSRINLFTGLKTARDVFRLLHKRKIVQQRERRKGVPEASVKSLRSNSLMTLLAETSPDRTRS